MTSTVLRIEGLTKQYKRFTLGPIDLQVERGTVVALLGTNGSGKSTLLRLLIGLIQGDKGKITLFENDLPANETEIRQNIGYVGGLYDTMGHLTIKELASFVAYWYPKWDQYKYLGLLKRYHIDENEKFIKCSKGTQKKVEFILALSYSPELLFLDEPSASVDIVSQRKMREDLSEYLTTGDRTIVIATHILDEVKQLSDFVYVLDRGKIIHTFEKDEIHEKWARLWVSDITQAIKDHPNTVEIMNPPLQIVTDDLRTIEAELLRENITTSHTQRLNMDEVLTFILEKTSDPNK